MRILITSGSIQYFQNYIRAEYFAKELCKRKHKVVILTASPKGEWYKVSVTRSNGLTIIVIPDIVNWRLRRGGLGPINFIGRFMISIFYNYDICHIDGHRPSVFFPSFIASKIKKKPILSEWMDIFGSDGIQKNRRGLLGKIIGKYDIYYEKKNKEMG